MKEEKVKFKGCNNREINAIIFYPEKQNPPAVIMVHGYGGEGLDSYWTDTARLICENGFAVMTFLFSAYNSAPDITDLSLKDEVEELKLAIDFLEKQKIDKNNIFSLSQSLGASISVLLNDNRIKAHVLLAFNPELKSSVLKTIFTEEALERLEKEKSVERKRLATGETRKIGQKFVNEINNMGDINESQIKKVEKPVLLIWGTEDIYTTKEKAQEFYNAFKGTKKIFFVENSEHVTVYDDYRDITLDASIKWFNKYLK